MTYKVARISTVPFFVNTQLSVQIRDINHAGYDVTVVCSEGDVDIDDVKLTSIEISRKISLVKDLVSCIELYKLFKEQRFDIVHSTTPKAGLLCAISGFLARVPIRLHTFTGQTWAETSSFKRLLLKFFDWLTVKLNTHVYADSPSQREFLIKQEVAKSSEISCLGEGSLAGVNLNRFSAYLSPSEKLELKKQYGIEDDGFVFLFLGRVTKDKGVVELFHAFEKLRKENANVSLIVVGPIEESMSDFLKRVTKDIEENVKLIGFSSVPEEFFSIADVLVLPSYREGFGTTIIEAAAMAVPAIGTNIYGLSDAIVDKETGILVPPKNIDELYVAMQYLAGNESEVIRLGENAKKRVSEHFSSDHISQLVISEYERLLEFKEK